MKTPSIVFIAALAHASAQEVHHVSLYPRIPVSSTVPTELTMNQLTLLLRLELGQRVSQLDKDRNPEMMSLSDASDNLPSLVVVTSIKTNGADSVVSGRAVPVTVNDAATGSFSTSLVSHFISSNHTAALSKTRGVAEFFSDNAETVAIVQRVFDDLAQQYDPEISFESAVDEAGDLNENAGEKENPIQLQTLYQAANIASSCGATMQSELAFMKGVADLIPSIADETVNPGSVPQLLILDFRKTVDCMRRHGEKSDDIDSAVALLYATIEDALLANQNALYGITLFYNDSNDVPQKAVDEPVFDMTDAESLTTKMGLFGSDLIEADLVPGQDNAPIIMRRRLQTEPEKPQGPKIPRNIVLGLSVVIGFAVVGALLPLWWLSVLDDPLINTKLFTGHTGGVAVH